MRLLLRPSLTAVLLAGVLVALTFDATPEARRQAFDATEYRTATYGPPDHYCSPTRALSSNGTGTVADPWNLTQCQALPVCGDVIGILNNGSAQTVDLAAPASDDEPAFDPDGIGDCANGNKLVYVTRYAAITLVNLADPTVSTIGTSPNRSEFRHAGAGDSADVRRDGGPVLGSNNHDNIVYDGFYVDMAEAQITGDGGVLTCRAATGVEFRNFAIKGTVMDVDSNAVIWRPDACADTVLSNFAVWDYDNVPTGGGLNQPGLFSDQYGDRNYLIEKFLLDRTDNGIFPKGTANSASLFNYGTIRYGIIRDVFSCIVMNDFHQTQLTTVEYVLCHDYTFTGLRLGSETSPPRNLLFHHNTIADGVCGGCAGPIYIKDDISAVNVTIRDNVLDYLSGGTGHGIDAGEAHFPFPTTNFNGYYHAGASMTWAYNGQEYPSLAAWRAATGQEAQSRVLATSPFLNRSGNDFTITAGHEAKTASSTGGELGAFASGIAPGPTVGAGPPQPGTPPLRLRGRPAEAVLVLLPLWIVWAGTRRRR